MRAQVEGTSRPLPPEGGLRIKLLLPRKHPLIKMATGVSRAEQLGTALAPAGGGGASLLCMG